jgi:hypothetical protein
MYEKTSMLNHFFLMSRTINSLTNSVVSNMMLDNAIKSIVKK